MTQEATRASGTSVQTALASAMLALSAAGVETPRLDAQLLLAWVLQGRREDLIREPERLLSKREQIIFDKSIELRTLRRPLPYITGEAWFYGREFKINRAVLIPRPETELLVSPSLKVLTQTPNPKIADIGTGSGCLAVTLACERPDAQVWAVDLSENALKLARKNVVRYDLTQRVTLLQGDLLSPLPPQIRFDAIVSNPPYITELELSTLQPEVRDYEPTLALSGTPGATGTLGITLHQRLLSEARGVLASEGWLFMEVGQGQAEIVAQSARELGYQSVSIENDYAGIGRIVAACWQPLAMGVSDVPNLSS